MTLQVIRGETKNRTIGEELAARLGALGVSGDLYLGYPVLASADERVHVDALLASPDHGVVAFQIADAMPANADDWREVVDAQNGLYAVLDSQMGRNSALRSGRNLAFTIYTVTVLPTTPTGLPDEIDAEGGVYTGLADLGRELSTFEGVSDTLMLNIQAALQRVSTLRPSNKRVNVQSDSSRGAKLKEIEKSIANLDQWQNWAAIEMPEGPQRIRGLAGSGKTIVLALKASYLHAQNPDWKIAVTFQSRALYQQFEDLITRFSFEHIQDSPDFNQLRIMHAWGSGGRPGIYTSIAAHLGVTPRDFRYANQKYGMSDAFQGVCAELLRTVEAMGDVPPLFDAVLIDEAQDFPPEFFRLVYLLTKPPKRVVWGYDELQKLSESAMPSMSEMFGVDDEGHALETLEPAPGKAKSDIVLPTCYRNSHWSLAMAHALGYGIYREGGLVQHFDDLKLWTDVGYEVVSGTLKFGRTVRLRRGARSTPEYFDRLLDPEDSVKVASFDNAARQDEWVADQIRTNLTTDELEPTDILVVYPLSRTAKSRSQALREALERRGIQSHLVGVTSSVDEMRVPGSVAMAHIHRAKGNEAAMVYVMDTQVAAATHDARTARNTLFTAITRNKAWVRICGYGTRMKVIQDEIQAVRDQSYDLEFRLPTRPQIDALKRGEELGDDAAAEVAEQAAQSLSRLVEDLESGVLILDQLPADIRAKAVQHLKPQTLEMFDEQ
jgi:superfamily I DNA and RNA helicase